MLVCCVCEVTLRYKIGRKLVGDRTAKARPTAAGWGFTVSLEKTKMMIMGCSEARQNIPIQLEDGGNSCCEQFHISCNW